MANMSNAVGSNYHGVYPSLNGASERWCVSSDRVAICRGSSGVCNLIELVSTVKSVTGQLSAFNQEQWKWITAPMCCQALRAQQALEKQNCLMRLILKIIVWFCTGTTLDRQIDRLQAANGDINAYQTTLVEDAEEILEAENGLELYKTKAQEYLIPQRGMGRRPMGGIIHHLIQAATFQGSMLISLLREGKTWEDPEVIQLGDQCMHLVCLAYKLTMKYEAAWLEEIKDQHDWGQYCSGKAYCMRSQRFYPWLLMMQFESIYLFLRRAPECDAEGHWHFTALEDDARKEQFYLENTAQGNWRRQYNEMLALLDQEVGIAAIKVEDDRFLSEPDEEAGGFANHLSESNENQIERFLLAFSHVLG